MPNPQPGDRDYIPIEIPIMTLGFEDWIAVTAAQGMSGPKQLTLWRFVNPAITVGLVSRARCIAGFHDDHEPNNARGCWADYEPDEKPSRREERAEKAWELDK
jgi:hypothetical protein